jgi:hypothetical protein
LDERWPITDSEGRVISRHGDDSWDVPPACELAADRRRMPVLRFSTARVVSPRAAGYVSPARPTAGLLEQFVNLADASDARILAFARRWGPLTIYQHQDTSLRHRLPPLSLVRPAAINEEDSQKGRWDVEPVEDWRNVARKALAILRITEEIRGGREGSVEDWRTLDDGAPSAFEVWSTLSQVRSAEPTEALEPDEDEDAADFEESHLPAVDVPKMLLAQRLNAWLQLGHVIPRIDWTGSLPEPRHHLGGLRGAIGFELLSRVTSSAAMLSCSLCGKNYFRRDRRPKPGEWNYCPSCRSKGGAAKGQAHRRREARARMRAGKEIRHDSART